MMDKNQITGELRSIIKVLEDHAEVLEASELDMSDEDRNELGRCIGHIWNNLDDMSYSIKEYDE